MRYSLRRSREINTGFGGECHSYFTPFEGEEDQCAGDKPRSSNVDIATSRFHLFYLLHFSTFFPWAISFWRTENICAWATNVRKRKKRKRENTAARRRGGPMFLHREDIHSLIYSTVPCKYWQCVRTVVRIPLLFPCVTHDTSVWVTILERDRTLLIN